MTGIEAGTGALDLRAPKLGQVGWEKDLGFVAEKDWAEE